MDNFKSIALLKEVRQLVEALRYNDYKSGNRLLDRLSMLTKKIFVTDSSYLNQLDQISFNSSFAMSEMPESILINAYNRGKESLLSILDTMLEDLQLSDIEIERTAVSGSKQNLSDRIFIIHGHNEEMKQSVARTIEQIDLKPVILHEQASKGRTIIEKFTDHSNVSFAIALLSADDFGYSVMDKVENGKFRARQNVILELGFFLGKLGRQKVVALFETNESFEFPSDYDGVIFIPYDKKGKWKFDLIKELKACEYDVDANKIL